MLALVSLALGAASSQTCTTAADCSLNGDCVSGVCQCDAAWSGAANCAVMSFQVQNKTDRPGYYNQTFSAWGGLPIKGDDGSWHLFHAQMANHCPLGSWTTNSIVARSTASSLGGPYTFTEEVLPPFAHNPTIRKLPDGAYAIWFIGGWKMNASHCNGTGESISPQAKRTRAVEKTCDGHN